MPADIVGTRIYNQKLGEFEVSLGPIFANLVLADEINRAPAKVQSALLEAMQERQVTIGRETHPLPDPFLVMATQNPIESDGTYPLPEAQVDRFMLKVLVDYPSATEEFVIVERMIAGLETLHEVMGAEQLRRAPEGRPDRVRRPGPDRVRRRASPRPPATPRRSASTDLARYVTYRREPAGVDQHGPRRAGAGARAGPPVRAAGGRCARSRRTCSATGLSCPTKRSATTSSAQHVIDAVLRKVPVPDVVLRAASR